MSPNSKYILLNNFKYAPKKEKLFLGKWGKGSRISSLHKMAFHKRKLNMKENQVNAVPD